MGQKENLDKLRDELQKEFTEGYQECQVFCIMTRIRKVLEHYNLKNKFSVLNFYCNWVLHTKIDRGTGVVREILKKEDPTSEELMSFLTFNHFKIELKSFIKNYPSLPEMEEEYKRNFLKILTDILIDTPLIISFPAGNVTFQFHHNPTSIGRIGSLRITRNKSVN
ncbi:MAG: hypothetical protein Q8P65_00220 [bacterium]|nr:hypothetical protein [bacterium]